MYFLSGVYHDIPLHSPSCCWLYLVFRMLRSRWVSACLLLGAILVAAQNRDVTMRIRRGGNSITVAFSWISFKELLDCFCKTKHEKCVVDYNSRDNHVVESVDGKGDDDRNNGDNRRYYKCSRPTWESKLECVLQNNPLSCSNDNRKFQSFRMESSSCASVCISLIWDHNNENIRFQNNDNAVEFFDKSCTCPVATTTTTTTTTTITTTTVTTTTLPPTRTNIPKIPSTTEFLPTNETTAANSASSDSDNDTSVGLIIGVIIAVICIVIIISLIGFFLWRRRKSHNTSKPQKEGNNSANTGAVGNVRSSPQTGFTDLNRSSPYTVPSSPSTYSHIESSHSALPSHTTNHHYNKILNDNAVNEAKSKKTLSSENELKGNKDPYELASENVTDKTEAMEGSHIYANAKQNLTKQDVTSSKSHFIPRPDGSGYELAQAVEANDDDININNTSPQLPKQDTLGANADYGYSAISDAQDLKGNYANQSKSGLSPNNLLLIEQSASSTANDQDNTQASVSQYEYTGAEPPYKDPGYEYAGPEYPYDTVTYNKAAQLDKDSSHKAVPGTNGMYSVARNMKNSSTEIPTDQSKDIYSRLHEENRQIQNPYNTLMEPPTDAEEIHAANQPSRYSFAQPTSVGLSNENTVDNSANTKADTPQNHTYHVLAEVTKQDTDEGKENNSNHDNKRDIYFELEEQ